jgi:hypothetical protein
MPNKKIQTVLLIAVSILFVLGTVLAQALKTTSALGVGQVFASTISVPAAIYSNPSGGFQTLQSIPVDLKLRSMLVITFSARGVVQPPKGQGWPPIVLVKCEIDSTPCQPNSNSVDFLYPQFCCDTRSFTWVVHAAEKGTHHVTILWGMGNPTSATITNRTLVVEAARL